VAPSPGASGNKYRAGLGRKSRKAPAAAAWIAAALTILLPAGCGAGRRPEKLILPETPVLAVRSTWAVVKSPLLRVRADASSRSEVLSHIRTGVVVEIIARSDSEDTIEGETGSWYRINYDGLKGWVFGSYLEIFDSRAKAEQFAGRME
jgi:hypothetical protein